MTVNITVTTRFFGTPTATLTTQRAADGRYCTCRTDNVMLLGSGHETIEEELIWLASAVQRWAVLLDDKLLQSGAGYRKGSKHADRS